MNLSKKFKRLLIIAITFSLLGLVGAYLLLNNYTSSIGDGSLKVDFVIKAGAGSISITNNLYREGLIKSRTAFKALLRLHNDSNKLKKGYYQLHDAMTSAEIIDILTSGKTKTVRITIPEGYNNRQIGDLLTKAKFFDSRKEFLELAKDKELLKKYNIAAATLEGYIFPDTYYFPIGYNKRKIMKHFIKSFQQKTKGLQGFPENAQKVHQLIILASIVEREAKLKEERSQIAGVFANRIRKHYPLESCATIQYLFEKPRKKLYFKDLKRPSPYNTYLHQGLPPGPISNPGLAAIEAALHPAETEYLYFVVRGDGSHKFSKTFNEHVRAKKRFLLKK